MRHDEIPEWKAERDIRYGSMLVRQYKGRDDHGAKVPDGTIVIYADDQTAKLAAAAPSLARILVNYCFTKEFTEQAAIKFVRDARVALTQAGIDLWDFDVPRGTLSKGD